MGKQRRDQRLVKESLSGGKRKKERQYNEKKRRIKYQNPSEGAWNKSEEEAKKKVLEGEDDNTNKDITR
jgi:hypothetical protein